MLAARTYQEATQQSPAAPACAARNPADRTAALLPPSRVTPEARKLEQDAELAGWMVPDTPASAFGKRRPSVQPRAPRAPSGESLPAAERSFFEERFGRDLGHVRIHRDDAAAQRAHALSANAFAIGSDITFAVGKYTPGTRSGRSLLGHELTHVLQQEQRGMQLLQRDASPPELQSSPVVAQMTDEELVERYDRIQQVLSTFTESTPDTAALEEQLGHIGVELGRRRALLAGRTFTDDAIKKMRDYFVNNAKTEKDSCIVALNKAMHIATSKPDLPTTPETIEKTMAKIAASGHSSEAREVWFEAKGGKISRGGARPEKLHESIWDTVISLTGGDPGWSVFTMSLLDGYHSVTLTLDANDPAKPRISWSDQWKSKGGWKEYDRAGLDAEVTRLVQSWWDEQAVGKKFPPVVRLWRMRSAAAAAAP
jgi:hypothetical protein